MLERLAADPFKPQADTRSMSIFVAGVHGGLDVGAGSCLSHLTQARTRSDLQPASGARRLGPGGAALEKGPRRPGAEQSQSLQVQHTGLGGGQRSRARSRVRANTDSDHRGAFISARS